MSDLETYRVLKEERYVVVAVRGDAGVVADPKSSGVPKGVVALFAQPPQNVGNVVCYDFQIRTSKKGRQYIKCFKWVLPEKLGDLIQELRRKLVKEEAENATLTFPPSYREKIRRFLETGEIPKLQDAVVFYDGIPIEPGEKFYVAVVDRSGAVYECGAPGWGAKVLAPPGVYVERRATFAVELGLLVHSSFLEKEEGRVIEIRGDEYIIIWNKTLARALNKLLTLFDDTDMPREMAVKVSKKLVEIVSGGGK